ncbi:MAG: acyltransferase [Rhodobacteraceae bacterium]|nr:acyltransferase [Paracoccaceae bacterium]
MLNHFTFKQCRARFRIADGYDNNNEIITDGDIADLPNIKFLRHGNLKTVITGCQFHFHSTARGNFTIVAAASKSVVHVGPHTRCNADIRLWRNPRVSIGAHTTINQARLVADNSDITIKEDCMFSDDIIVQSADQHGLIDLETMQFSNGARRKIVIGEHVWIGRRSILMPDIEIGAGSVVGAGSTVTKSATSCSYLVGVPAKSVRRNASWTRMPNQINQREERFFERMRTNNAAQKELAQ